MQLELIFSSEHRFLGGIRALIRETLAEIALKEHARTHLLELVTGAAENAIRSAYPIGETGKIELALREEHGRLEFMIRDYGLPQDVAALERRQHEAAANAPLRLPKPDVVDEVHWVAFGRNGKALQLIKWLESHHVLEASSPDILTAFHDDVTLAPTQDYTIRRMLPNEATQVSQLIYRAYGPTYFNEDVYYPDRVAAHNARGSVLSFVAAGADGKLVGHYALERNQEGPVAEGGQAVVDPAHRGRGLLEQMKDAALAEAEKLGLSGWYADAVTIHTMTQKSNIKHGAQLTCVDLAIAPKSESFRNIAGDLPQRITCLLYFHWLTVPTRRRVHVPKRHQEVVSAIYDHLQCPVEFRDGSPSTGHGSLHVTFDAGAATGFIRVQKFGADSLAAVRHAKRELLERSHAEVVYCELPISDPSTPAVGEALEAEGFGFLGILPCFSSRGDVLRLGYLVEPVVREPIQIADDTAANFVEYVLAEQRRVRSTL